jgi:hypothetical protein
VNYYFASIKWKFEGYFRATSAMQYIYEMSAILDLMIPC